MWSRLFTLEMFQLLAGSFMHAEMLISRLSVFMDLRVFMEIKELVFLYGDTFDFEYFVRQSTIFISA